VILVRLGIDYENPATLWWESGGRELWEGIAEDAEASSIVVEESIASSWLAEAEGIPGWSDGPDYAPHPIRLTPVDEDEDV
jgi:hypothetical protein